MIALKARSLERASVFATGMHRNTPAKTNNWEQLHIQIVDNSHFLASVKQRTINKFSKNNTSATSAYVITQSSETTASQLDQLTD